ncbi:RDD family protein [Amphritea balenae]|uniref:RDD family protein n=1 Tax=Amphritea balenae TaxID=452629 RepID=A0A3P1STR2_9GAMM|nr:RDD family protein [Amphritea balenae]RRD00541.1 RDD family protein [Amphritea balenae]GGK69878.1 RDD family protein [Amphritea balenae]
MNSVVKVPRTDTIRTHETPEGIRLELRLAGLIVRACAWTIDMLIRFVLYGVISFIFTYFGGVGTAVMLIMFFLIEWFYPVIFEIHSGATPGKKAMGLVVIHDNGTPVSFSSSVIRNLLRAADFLPFMYAAGILSVLMSRDFQRLGDLAAGTLVVYRDKELERIKLPDAAIVRPSLELSVEEQSEIIRFAERCPQLSVERQAELATQLSYVTGKQGTAAVQELLGYAAWLTRGRG